MKTTKNGRGDVTTGDIDYFRLDGIYNTMARRDAEWKRRDENVKKTIESRTPETLKRQESHYAKKQANEERLKEIENILKNELEEGKLIERIVASFNVRGIDETLTLFENDLKTYKLYSDEYKNLAEEMYISGAKIIPFYDNLLLELALKFPRFITHLPTSCFTYHYKDTNLPLGHGNLSLEELREIQSRLEQDGIFNNEVFRRNYLKFFPDHVTEIDPNKINEIAYALSIEPACFNNFKVDGSFRSRIKDNINILDTIAIKAPKVLKYATQEEIELYAKKLTSHVGNAIAKCPEILENFPLNFFDRYQPKHVFGLLIKTRIKDGIVPYFDKFPILETYFASKKMVTKPKAEVDNNPPITSIDDDGLLDF